MNVQIQHSHPTPAPTVTYRDFPPDAFGSFTVVEIRQGDDKIKLFVPYQFRFGEPQVEVTQS
jgi:hypothetical protein